MTEHHSVVSRRSVTLAGVALLAALALFAMPATAAAERVALVVGNNEYPTVGRLANPGNDATDVAAALDRLGFEVTTVRDADLAGMNEALRRFTRASAGASVALVFYAGHGLEVDGVNYLVPVDAQLERDTDVRFETVVLDDVLAATEGAELRVVILDACRNNPLTRSIRRTNASRSVSQGSFSDLGEELLGDETLVAYAAAAGTTAADGTGNRNSPYTAALLEYLEQPLEIGVLFRAVRARVLETTRGTQRPHEYASLLSQHYLRAASEPSTATLAGAGDSAGIAGAARAELEMVFWQSIAASSNPADFEAYLRQFPAGVYRALARNRLAGLDSGDPPSVPAGSSVRPPGPPVASSAPPPNPGPGRFESRPSAVEDAPPVPPLEVLLGRTLSRSGSDGNGWTDLHYAAALDLPDAIRRLVNEGANVNHELNKDGRPFDAALRRVLRRAGHDDFDTWTRDGETPLHVAAFVGAHQAAVELLASGANENAGTKFDWKPLHYAAWANASDVVEALLVHGADMDAETDEVNQQGRTPLELAVQAGSNEAAAVLRRAGAR